MATHNEQQPGPAAADARARTGEPNRQVVEFDRFIDDQLRKTRSRVRTVDVAGSLMLLAAGTLAYGFLAAIVDHWVVAGGLGVWGRTLFLLVFAVGATAYLATQLLPLVTHRINPVYAAQAIERSRPSLKNALVNFLFFRADPAGLSPVIYQAVEEQAATNLARSQVDSAVDRTKLIRIGYALTAILLVCAVYTLVSPKDLLKSVVRIAVPWAEIDAPTRTVIAEIEPRSTQAFRGQQVAVSARIRGLPSDSKARLYYSTADGQIVDRPLEMVVPADGERHACVLPGGEGSLQQDVSYRIEAGDAISPRFRIEVVAAPTIFVRAVEYKYPDYTGLVDQRVEHQGDVKAIEGTQVTVEAVANCDIDSAQVDFDCDGQLDQRMQTDGPAAKTSFRLALAEDRKTPWHNSYQLVFKNAQGQQNPQPVRHQIEVTRDVPPEIVFVAPKKDEIDLPLNGAVVLEIVANDPDFALRMVKLSATSGQKPLEDKLLLDEERRGQFVARYRFEPLRLGLKAGDVVEYSAVAEDNKDPRPNRSETLKRRVRIVSPDARQGGDDQLARNQQRGEGRNQPGAKGQRGDNDPNRGDDPETDANPDPPSGERADQPDGNAANHDERKRSDDQDRSARQPGDTERGDREQGENQQRENQPGENQPGENQQRGDQRGEGEERSGATAQERDGEQSGEGGQRKAAERRAASDGTDDGDAIERILKHRDEKNQEQQPRDDRRQGERSGERQQPGEERPDRQPSDDPGDQGANRDSQQQPGEQGKGADQQGKRGEKGQRGQQPQGGQEEGQQGRQDSTGQGEKADRSQPTDKRSGEQRAGEKRSDEKRSADQRGADDAAGQPGADEEKSAADRDKPAGDKGSKPAEASDDQQGKPQSKRGESGGKEARPGAKPDGKPDAGQNGQPGDDGKPQTGGEEKPSAKKSGGANQEPSKQDRRGGATRENTTPEKGQPDGQPTEGKGGQSKDDPTRDAQEKSGDAQRPDAKGGDGQHDKGQSGAGQKSQDQQGSPSPQESSQPRKKSQPSSPGDDDPKDSNQAQGASSDKRESDSQGQDDGDRSGGGKRGGGQKANKPGTGGAGQNTAADEGAGTSNEPGQGEDSQRAGSDRAADKPTGQGGSKPGDGSGTKPSSSQGGKPGSDSAADSQRESPGDKPSGASGTPGGGEPTGGQPGGQPNDRRPPDGPFKPGQEAADEANLEYARKATDLALAHLKDELKKDHPDPELLERLGWTRKELETFVKRWEAMRRAAQASGEPGSAAERELDETLRSLGLRPRATSQRANAGRDDRLQGLKESRRSSPPPEYDEQTKAYTQGTARGVK